MGILHGESTMTLAVYHINADGVQVIKPPHHITRGDEWRLLPAPRQYPPCACPICVPHQAPQ